MAQTIENMKDITLPLLSSWNGAGLTFDHKADVIDLLDRHSDEELGQNLAAVIILIRLMISFDETKLLDRCVSVFERNIDSYDGVDKNHLLMNFERFIGLSKYNNIAEMTEHFRKALTYLDGPFTGEERVGNWTFGSPSVLLMFHRDSGGLSRELEFMREGMPIYYELTDGHGYGAEFVMEAEAAFNAGDFTEAETTAHKAWYYAREKDQWSIMLTAVFLQMRLLLFKGDWFEILNNKRRIAETMEREKLNLLRHTLDICESGIFLLLDMPDMVTPWIAEGDASLTRVMFPAKPALNIVYGRYLLARGEHAKLCGAAGGARTTAANLNCLLGVIYSDIYLAAARFSLGQESAAIDRLRTALDAALPDNILMPFAENAGYIKELLNRLKNAERYTERITRVFELHKNFEQTKKIIQRKHFPRKTDVLSDDEYETASLAARDFSNKQIAEKLFLTEAAVKSRLINIFQKLKISKRKQLKDIFGVDSKM
ncbi:MAG: LuxR C-terminal-related transcriptional regulator [Oscillospiraceae bacterium]|nr:LuxR C-terminal-related transcriptional regulator [Oscillospiraceae bacterium]